MKFYHGLLVILFIMFVRGHNSQALKHKYYGHGDQAVRGGDDLRANSNDDNIKAGDNIRLRVQINGRTIETGTTDNESNRYNNGNRGQSRENSKDNVIAGDNIRNRVQINGRTIYTGTTDNESHRYNNGNRGQSRGNSKDNVIAGDNIRNRVQIDGRTIEAGTTDNESNRYNNGNRGQSRENSENYNGHNIKHQVKGNGRTTISQPSNNN